MAENQPTADELRKIARYVEDAASTAAETAAAEPPPLVIGGAQYFPQPAPEHRVLQRGSLQDTADEQVETLLTLAATLEAGGEVSPVLLADVQPLIDAYRAEQS